MRMFLGHPGWTVALALLFCLIASPPSHAAHYKRKAWFDVKGALCFPMGSGPLPATREQLVASLGRGWRIHLRFPEGGDQVTADNGRYPAIGRLYMNVAGGIMDPDRHKGEPGLRPTGHVERRIAVREFEFDGRPMICEKAKINLRVTASNAILDLEHDAHGRPMLMLDNAGAAMLDFGASRTDLERLLVLSGNEGGHRFGITVQSAQLSITTRNGRTIDVSLHLSTKVGFIPAGMRFAAHVDIDDQMNARVSHLRCDGDHALGPFIVGFIRPGLQKYEGATKPLFSFPGGQLKLHDVKIQGGEDVRVIANFGK